MKKETVARIAFLILALLAAIWLNYEPENSVDESGQSASDPIVADYVLAVSWQPAFCEQHPNKPECRSQRAGRFDTVNFSLHGLWPQPASNIYCGLSQNLIAVDRSGRWDRLPKLRLSDDLRTELQQKMPGYRSNLHRHEWFKHGTCMPGYSQEEYFRISLVLLDQLNNSTVRQEFESNLGYRLDFRDVARSFRHAFGREASNRFIMDCYRDDGRRVVQELKLSLKALLNTDISLEDALSEGSPVGSSCPGGVVDPVGLQ